MGSVAACAALLVPLFFVLGSAGPAAAAPEDLPPPGRSAREIRETAEKVLARPELRPPVKSIQQRVVEFVVRQVGRALNAVVGGGRGGLVGWVLLVTALAALVLFAVRFLATTGGGRRQPGEEAREPRRPAADWRAEAVVHEAGGRWKEALRCRYRALVADLAAAGVVEEVPGRTAGEYRSEIGYSLPAAGASFGPATELFEQVWYGDRPTGEGDNERFRRLADDVMARARRSSPPERGAVEEAGVGAGAGTT